MKRLFLIVGVILLAAAFLAGYWPQHQRAADAETAMRTARQELLDANRTVQLSELLGQLLRLSDAVDERNYGEAAALASSYFDRVRAETSSDQQPDVQQALQQILQSRDGVTAALARSDPSIAGTLRQQEITLRRALGYSVPPS